MVGNFDPVKAEIMAIGDFLKSGRTERALKLATKATKKWPDIAALPRLAGICAIQQQNFKLAQVHFQRAWQLEPNNPEMIQNYGLSLVQGGDSDVALDFIDQIRTRGPLPPAQQFIHAMALLRERQVEKALATVNQVLFQQPGNLQAHCLKADILDDMLQWERSADILKLMVGKNPKFHYGHLRLAKGLVGLGKMDEALEFARAAFALSPGDAETLELMASLPNLTDKDQAAVQAQIDKALKTENPNREAASMIRFAAASLARRYKDTAQEMAYLDAAHSLLWVGFQDWEDRSVKACNTRLNAALPAAAEGPRPDIPRPVFVVGLPRSGTTLVERILSAHSRVQGLGELAAVHQWARKTEAQSASLQAQDLAEFYADHLPGIDDDAAAFVDKAPGNYAFLGVMAQAFPDAVFINVQRDPRDVALSMWRTHFGAGGLYYTHDLTWMAAEANRYRRYMQHWHAVLPGRIHDISYEYLVNNLQDATEALAGLCDLSFEENMLSPHVSADAVRTASNLQVRKPVNAASVGGWRSVADHLAPFVEGLDADLWPEVQA